MPTGRRRYSAEERERAVRAALDSPLPVAAVARAMGVGAGALRRWLRDESGNAWADRVDRHFGFLTRYGFVRGAPQVSGWWAVRTTYRAARSAVAVIRNHEYGRVDVELMRLVHGALPTYPIFIVDSEPLNTFHADHLLLLRRPDARAVLAQQRGLSDEEVEAQLAFWSSALQAYGQDLLAGDLRVLDELEREVREYARRHRQEVSVWLPEAASDAVDAATVEQVRAVTPEDVTITSRRYRQK
jgi:hypothetical protein